MKYIDLHTHSTSSDGTLTPSELVTEAQKKGLIALSLTDHDSIDGLAEAQKKAAELGLEFIDGIELSLGTSAGSVHMLGYMFDYTDKDFLHGLSLMNKRREERNIKFISRFRELGIEIKLDELLEIAGDGSVGRPHFAKLLMKKGVVKTFDEAFDKYLAKKKAAYVEKEKVAPEEGIKLIHNAKGLAVLAHPKYCGAKTFEEVEALVRRLKQAGLDGIECFYSDHSVEETEYYLSLAEKYGLFVTGGSDYHGTTLHDKKLGEFPDGKRIDYALLETMKEHFAKLYRK